MTMSIDALSWVWQVPHQSVFAETGLTLATSLWPFEISSAADPPCCATRDDGWTIDTLLGCYNSQERKIAIFDKGIEHVARQLQVKRFFVEHVVRVHEWGHACFHLGVDRSKSAELAMASQKNDESAARTTGDNLTGIYSSVDPYVHEQIAQSITWLALENPCTNAVDDDSSKACA